MYQRILEPHLLRFLGDQAHSLRIPKWYSSQDLLFFACGLSDFHRHTQYKGLCHALLVILANLAFMC